MHAHLLVYLEEADVELRLADLALLVHVGSVEGLRARREGKRHMLMTQHTGGTAAYMVKMWAALRRIGALRFTLTPESEHGAMVRELRHWLQPIRARHLLT